MITSKKLEIVHFCSVLDEVERFESEIGSHFVFLFEHAETLSYFEIALI